MDEDYGITGARAEVEELVEVPVEKFWAAVTDLSRIGEWSPECTYSGWLDGWSEPEVGARFEARNQFPNGVRTQVVCVVTAAEPPHAYAWEVYSEDPEAEEPLAVWRYDLRPAEAPGRTVVRQSFTHGPGDSGVRAVIREDPANAATMLEGRLEQLRGNMSTTIKAMARDVGGAPGPVG